MKKKTTNTENITDKKTGKNTRTNTSSEAPTMPKLSDLFKTRTSNNEGTSVNANRKDAIAQFMEQQQNIMSKFLNEFMCKQNDFLVNVINAK